MFLKNGHLTVLDEDADRVFWITTRIIDDAGYLACECEAFAASATCSHVEKAAAFIEGSKAPLFTRRQRATWWNTFSDPHRRAIRKARTQPNSLVAIFDEAYR
jgi:hypothetical protein